eukprot:CAMPEP_0115547692 /NCGR_PEP_ID=MMETSP0271-20121206/93779_1 /TAXON_ID=71861 /ORGANISM="Scrippsiella trochoidea, Strain CCMP3099" /LENGTH=118 /DNA_ID=CAMNT_0002981135 /DNA_START=622 /DNA_END=974 /DNA_ORIENTATION=-
MSWLGQQGKHPSHAWSSLKKAVVTEWTRASRAAGVQAVQARSPRAQRRSSSQVVTGFLQTSRTACPGRDCWGKLTDEVAGLTWDVQPAGVVETQHQDYVTSVPGKSCSETGPSEAAKS